MWIGCFGHLVHIQAEQLIQEGYCQRIREKIKEGEYKNMKKIEFEAICSGDYECFTFAVDKDTYIRILGKEPDSLDKNSFFEGLYDIYPSELFENYGEEKRKKSFKIEIE